MRSKLVTIIADSLLDALTDTEIDSLILQLNAYKGKTATFKRDNSTVLLESKSDIYASAAGVCPLCRR